MDHYTLVQFHGSCAYVVMKEDVLMKMSFEGLKVMYLEWVGTQGQEAMLDPQSYIARTRALIEDAGWDVLEFLHAIN